MVVYHIILVRGRLIMSKKPSKKYKDRVIAEKFVKAWMESSNIYEVAEKLDLQVQSTVQRGKKYVEKGIHLKKLPLGGPGKGHGERLNIKAINEYIKNFAV